ncbi:MAG: hypothetical protein UHD09_02080 [Bifidobacterium sp.]|nr:hypothetical protein [Bifidobacterium sp.]
MRPARCARPARATLARIPSTPLPTLEATPGALRAVVSGDTRATRELTADEHDGVWLSRQAADTSGAAVGSVEELSDGTTVRIAGIYESPDDGRSVSTSYALVQPVAADGAFDQCVVKAWPVPDGIESLVLASVGEVSGNADDQPRVRQANTRLGASLDSTALFATRATAVMTLVAAVGGAALGFVAARLRRLEFASALHCGVPKAALVTQMVVETGCWALCAAVIATPLLAVIPWLWSGDTPGQIALLCVRPLGAAVVGSLAGGVLVTVAVRERHLFRYFKDRA